LDQKANLADVNKTLEAV
jgi:hypothetical protein